MKTLYDFIGLGNSYTYLVSLKNKLIGVDALLKFHRGLIDSLEFSYKECRLNESCLYITCINDKNRTISGRVFKKTYSKKIKYGIIYIGEEEPFQKEI